MSQLFNTSRYIIWVILLTLNNLPIPKFLKRGSSISYYCDLIRQDSIISLSKLFSFINIISFKTVTD